MNFSPINNTDPLLTISDLKAKRMITKKSFLKSMGIAFTTSDMIEYQEPFCGVMFENSATFIDQDDRPCLLYNGNGGGIETRLQAVMTKAWKPYTLERYRGTGSYADVVIQLGISSHRTDVFIVRLKY